MLLLAALIVFIIQSSCVILKNKMIFHKRRIIKVTHASGEVDYNVEINGFLGLPDWNLHWGENIWISRRI